MLDCGPSEIEDPSDQERGVSPPEVEVQVLECKHVIGASLLKSS